MRIKMSGLENDLEPAEFYLSQNYPNPFKTRTVIKYCVALTTKVKITVFDAEGREVVKLVDEEKNPGTYEVVFQVSEAGRQSAIESYYYRLEAGDYRSEMKMESVK
jgi:hypothetical protein